MRVLHLFSNSKWTGPAEPALQLCLSLRQLGVDCEFACSPGKDLTRNQIVATARAQGLEPWLDLRLLKHRNPLANWHDRRTLAKRLRIAPFDLIHCHLNNDHRIVIPVASSWAIPVVRSSYEGEGFQEASRVRDLLPETAFLIEPSKRALEHDATRYSFPRERMEVVPGAVDTRRFDPARPLPDMRARLGVPAGAFVVGIVARMQLHRHYEDFWDAIAKLVHTVPSAHVIVVGRGTNQERVGFEPVRGRGLESRVHFTGYVSGDDYVAALQAFDVKVFLVPGSDGTCRAVREALAMGKPAVVADRGMLSEIVQHGVDGVVFDGSSTALAECLIAWAQDPQRVRIMAEAARAHALAQYSLPQQANHVLALYGRILP